MSSWANFTHGKHVKTDVDGIDVLSGPWGIVVFINLWSSKEDELHIWNPDFISRDNLLPNASKYMNVHKHHEYHISNFISSFRFFTPIQVHYHFSYFLQSYYLEEP